MDSHNSTAGVVRFGVFELDTRSGELRRHGRKSVFLISPFRVLRLLLTRPGDVVTRDELRHALWTSETFVDFDVGLNSAIRKLREALDDSADDPRVRRNAAAARLSLHRDGRPAGGGQSRARAGDDPAESTAARPRCGSGAVLPVRAVDCGGLF